MLRDCLAGHVQPLAQLAKRPAILQVQSIQQLPAARIGQSAKHSILIHAVNRELLGSISIGNLLVTCQGKTALFRPRSEEARSLPLDRAGRFGSDVVDDAVDVAHFVDDAGRGAAEEFVREREASAVIPSVELIARKVRTKS